MALGKVGGCQVGGGERPGAGWAGALPLHHHSGAQLADRRLGRSLAGRQIALHLHPVAPPVPEGWVGEALLQATLVGEQQQALAISIQPTRGIHAREVDEIGQAAPATAGFRRELAENPVGLVEQDGGQSPIPLRTGGPSKGSPRRSRSTAGPGRSTKEGTPWSRLTQGKDPIAGQPAAPERQGGATLKLIAYP
jgi:hypothetical protein